MSSRREKVLGKQNEPNEITQVVTWLIQHPSYVSAGYALAEYAAKSVFVHDELSTILKRIQNLAEMPPLSHLAVPATNFATVLAVTPPAEHQVAALHAFDGNPWYEIGASCQAVTQRELHASYEKWRGWGKRHWPLLSVAFMT